MSGMALLRANVAVRVKAILPGWVILTNQEHIASPQSRQSAFKSTKEKHGVGVGMAPHVALQNACFKVPIASTLYVPSRQSTL